MKEEIRHLRALKNGDHNGLRWVYTKYFRVIFLYCKKLIGEEALAEEAAAEVFVTLWKKRAIINTDQTIQPFLYRIAKFTAYDHLKKIANDQRLREQFLLNHELIHSKSGEHLLIEKEQLEVINRLLDTLPAKRRAVFKMRYLEGKDNKAIAEQLQISINTVKVHLVKARHHLKEQLQMQSDIYSATFFTLECLLMFA